MDENKELLKKYKWQILFFVLLVIIIPICINEAYKFGANHIVYITSWKANDVLAYYGTILGASATIYAVLSTIKFTKKSANLDRINNRISADEDRKFSENIALKNIGSEVCFDFIESLKRGAPYFILCDLMLHNNSVMSEKEKKNLIELVKHKIAMINSDVSMQFEKFQFVYPKLCEKNLEYIKNFIDENRIILNRIGDSFFLNQGMIDCNYELFKDLDNFQGKYPEFVGTLREIMNSYDVRLGINCNLNETRSCKYCADNDNHS